MMDKFCETRILQEFREDRLGQFYKLVWPGLVLYTNKLLGYEHEFIAEDIVQDAVFGAWERKNSFESLNHLKFFLYTAIKNSVISFHRNHSARQRYIDKLDNENEFINSILEQEARSIIFNAVNELPEKMRQIFVMNFFEGLKIREIAERLDLTESSIKKYKSKGLSELRLKLDPKIFLLLLAGIN